MSQSTFSKSVAEAIFNCPERPGGMHVISFSKGVVADCYLNILSIRSSLVDFLLLFHVAISLCLDNMLSISRDFGNHTLSPQIATH
jgi:hypothetical protein